MLRLIPRLALGRRVAASAYSRQLLPIRSATASAGEPACRLSTPTVLLVTTHASQAFRPRTIRSRRSFTSSSILCAGGRPTPTLTPPPSPTNISSTNSNQTHKPLIRDAVREALQDFDRRHTYRGWHLLNFLGAAGAGSIVIFVLFYDDIIHWLSGQVSELARQTISDVKLQQEVDRVTKVTTNALLNDPEVIEVTVEFLLRLLEKQETRANVVKFLSAVIVDPSTVNALSELLKNPATVRQVQNLFNVLLQDPTIQQSLNVMVQNLLADDKTKAQFENLMVDLFQQQRVKSVVADFFGEVLRYDSVVTAATDSSRLIVEDLSKDDTVHRNLASAGTSAVKQMVISPFVFRTSPKKQSDVGNDASSASSGSSDSSIGTNDMEIEILSEEMDEIKAKRIVA